MRRQRRKIIKTLLGLPLLGTAQLLTSDSFGRAETPFVQRVVFQSENNTYSNLSSFLNDWNAHCDQRGFRIQPLMPSQSKDILFEFRRLLDSRTIETTRVWANQEAYEAWGRSLDRKKIELFLKTSNFKVVEDKSKVSFWSNWRSFANYTHG